MCRWTGVFGVAWLIVGLACTSSIAESAVITPRGATGAAVAAGALASPGSLDVLSNLQGLYDEATQVTVPFMTEADVELFDDVLYTPDWVFVDVSGRKQTRADVREQANQAASAAVADSVIQRIQKLSLLPDGATTIVNRTIVNTIVDADGRYGRRGAIHTITETTVYRDTWVKAADEWKMKSREQLKPAQISVDKREWGG
jgi:hypothetical protein